MAVTSKNNLRQGSQGSDVTELQKMLNSTGYGYNLDEDGIFGSKTLAAVKDYQQRNNLAVDGIVGTNTWGALTGGQGDSSSNTTNAPAQTESLAFNYEAYKPSDNVAQAEALLQQQLAQKPGDYTSAWQSQLNDIIQKIQNREKFTYDLNGDALYQQYKDQYMTQGKLAMMDTMGQAAAMTGGYGNSYAQTAGQQAYQGYLQGLNDKVPELYQLALSKYNAEGDEMYNQASLLAGMEDQDYGRYRDTVSDYYTELNRLTEEARYKSETEYGRWADDLNMKYQMHRDDVADEQWQSQFEEAKRQYDLSYEHDGPDGPDGPGDPDEPDDPGYDNGKVSEANVKLMQASLGLSADGKWGAESSAATGGLSADEAYKLFLKGTLPGMQRLSDGYIKRFMNTVHLESNHDAVMRATYGPYTAYVAYMLEKDTTLSDAEKNYLISYYGITSSDRQYLIDKGLIK